MSATLDRCLNVADFARLARRRLPRPIFDFIDGAAEDEKTLRRNRSSFDEWGLIPLSMRRVDAIDSRRRVLGQALDWPFIIAPTGMPGLLHPDGELGLARAAEAVGALYVLSTMASRSIEEVATATRGPKAFQLYLFRDRGLTLDLIQRAKAAGYGALILTVDVQVPANRERDKRSGMVIPPRFGLRSMMEFARAPRWCWNVLVRRPVTLANFSGARATPGVPLMQFINEQFDPVLSWADIEWVARHWGGPLAIKGVLDPEDAHNALEHGATAIILSNHGGRQLDAAVSPLDVLPSVRQRLGQTGEIILDGGVRRGTDMAKALALGANACMSGRVGLYGLGAGGSAGATAALQTLRTEFLRDLALLGTPTLADLDGARIRHLHDLGARHA